MPDPTTHFVFGQQVMAQLPEDIQDVVDRSVFQRALQGPDPWSYLGLFGGKSRKYALRGSQMHKSKTGLFLAAITKQAKEEHDLFSVLAGAVCHYCLDRRTHPYIISRSDGTGGHTRLERGIDSYYIRTVYGKTPWHFSLTRIIFSCKQYPENLRPGLDTVYREVYGWENAFALVNQSLWEERLFYALMQDPLGLMHYLLRLIPSKKTNYSVYSFFRREIDREKVDYLNEKHIHWQHPFEPSILSEESFFDLFERAKGEAAVLIRTAYDWIFLDGESFPSYENSNYSTGFDCDDPRNEKEPLCQPLTYSGKYWN